jgi:hypothetical protein
MAVRQDRVLHRGAEHSDFERRSANLQFLYFSVCVVGDSGSPKVMCRCRFKPAGRNDNRFKHAKMKEFLLIIALAAASSSLYGAAEQAEGRWEGSVQIPDRELTIVVDLALSGWLEGGDQ